MKVYEISFNDLDNLVQVELGIDDYECVASLESSNDVWYLYKDVSSCVTNEPFDTTLHPAEALNELCYMGIIEPGNWLLEVSW